MITQPDRPAGRKMALKPTAVKSAAQELRLEVHSPASVNTPEFLDQLKGYGADAAVVVAFGQILSQQLLDLFPKGMVNVHGSLLPRWRGAAPIQRALMAGDKETGVSLQKVVRKLDAGDVLGERKVLLDDKINAAELYTLLSELGAELLGDEFLRYLDGELVPTPQDEALITIAPKIQKTESKIDWTWDAKDIHNLVRGLGMGPHAWTYCGAKKLKIHSTKVVTSSKGAKPGEVINVTPQTFQVQCGQGALEVLEVQPESKTKMATSEYLRGHELRPGDRLVEPETNRSS